mgnify:FL=1
MQKEKINAYSSKITRRIEQNTFKRVICRLFNIEPAVKVYYRLSLHVSNIIINVGDDFCINGLVFKVIDVERSSNETIITAENIKPIVLSNYNNFNGHILM